MAYYRKIPVVIEAEQYSGTNLNEILQWIDCGEAFWDAQQEALVIRTLEGDMKASQGDFIIKGIEGEFYPCRVDIFAATYELVDDVYEILDHFDRSRISDAALLDSWDE